jgi:hypothetical protein
MNTTQLKLLNPQRLPPKAEPETLSVIDSVSLLALPVKPTKFIISQLMPVGLNILAGSPKVGKSWLAFWLCLQVAKGEPVWEYETQQCAVLYLALEDNVERLQLRHSRITDKGSRSLFFATSAGTIIGSLLEQLEMFMLAHPDVGLIVIDTLQKINPNTNGTYYDDSGAINKIKSFADGHRIAILLVHHVKKQVDSDVINNVLGSSGITGSADNIYVLAKDSRIDSTATLHAIGRDIKSVQIPLIFDSDTCVWNLDAGVDELLADALDAILADCDTYEGTATNLLMELKKHIDLDINPNVLSRRLGEMKTALEVEYGICMNFKKKNNKRIIAMSHIDKE